MTPVRDLIVGTTIILAGAPVTIIWINPIEQGYVELIWGGGGEDGAVLHGDREVEVVDG